MSLTNIAVLGSTGSIGTQTLDVVRQNPDKLKISSLVAGSNVDLFSQQVEEFKPRYAVLSNEESYNQASSRLAKQTTLLFGDDGIDQVLIEDDLHVVVAAISGFAGLKSVLKAIDEGKDIALANKEALIAGGELVSKKLASSKSRLVPVDSEHSSIYQCLMGRRKGDLLSKIVLTASGGPFLNTDISEFEKITPEMALKHPKWSMGAKISIDSATLMNKGLEVIEAAYLFDINSEKIEVLIHPQSIVHGLVSYADASVVALMFETDMRVPISFALSQLSSDGSQARNLNSSVPQLDLASHQKLEFQTVDHEKFPALKLCYQALRSGQAETICLNAANEVAVAAFLDHKLRFKCITNIVEQCLSTYNFKRNPTSFGEILEIDAYSRELASKHMNKSS